jgi:cobalamin biosynthesis protein CobT
VLREHATLSAEKRDAETRRPVEEAARRAGINAAALLRYAKADGVRIEVRSENVRERGKVRKVDVLYVVSGEGDAAKAVTLDEYRDAHWKGLPLRAKRSKPDEDAEGDEEQPEGEETDEGDEEEDEESDEEEADELPPARRAVGTGSVMRPARRFPVTSAGRPGALSARPKTEQAVTTRLYSRYPVPATGTDTPKK